MFPNIKPANRPLVKNVKISDPNWVTGFTAGEGCFAVKASKIEHGLKTARFFFNFKKKLKRSAARSAEYN